MAPKIATDERIRLRRRVVYWARRLKVAPRTIRIQRMTRKWGSCSSSGRITLADDLMERSSDFQAFVIVHELLHLRVPNHGKLFRAMMSAYIPNWRVRSIEK